MDDLSRMSNAELDTALAVEMQGWNLLTNSFGLKEYWGKDGRRISLAISWHPTTSIDQAKGCLDEMRKYHLIFIESRPHIECWSVRLTTWDTPIQQWRAENKDLCRAICEAVLQATRGEKEREDAKTATAR